MARPKIDDFKVTGNLVEDPKRVTTDQGKNLVVLKVAENTRFYDREAQQWADGDPNYYEVAIDADARRLGNLAENVAQSLSKGDRVAVEGSYAATPHQTREGNLGVNHRIWADDVSPSLRFATAQVERNPAPQASAETSADFSQGWDTVTPGAGYPQTEQPSAERGGPSMS